MYKKISALLCLTFSIVLFCMAVSATEAETTDISAIYVSGTAEEGGTGVISAPVSTLDEAYSLLENSGTIYLMDTVSVSVTSDDCFIAPAHTGKITITSADGYDGALDLTAVKHMHFGGETEWNNIGIIANDVVLTADNNTVTMGEGLTVSSHSDDTYYRGGHTYCGARIHLAAYAPCETANVTCDTAAGKLYVHSGEYWSVSSWYGDTVTINGGSTLLYLGKRAAADLIWVRYLCPGLYGESLDVTLTTIDADVTIVVDDGMNTAEPFRFTKDNFSGSLTANWVFRDTAQGRSTAFYPKNFSVTAASDCILNVYVEQGDFLASASASLLTRGSMDTYVGSFDGSKLAAEYCEELGSHSIYKESNGQLICSVCGFEQCRHLLTTTTILEEANCTSPAYYQWQCDDICFESVCYYEGEVNPNNHSVHVRKYIGNLEDATVEELCNGCEFSFGTEEVLDETVLISAESDFDTAMRKAAKIAAVYGEATLQLDQNVNVPAGYSTPVYDGHITITGKQIWFKEYPRRFYMNGDVTFENITFRTNSSTAGMVICAQNHKLVMGEGIVMGNVGTIPTEEGFPASNCVKMYVVGGFEGAHDNVMDTDITIRSGDYWYIGGWNYNASTNDGEGKITIGKTNPDDKLQVFYLCPFSRGDGFITKLAESTIIIDGALHVKRFYVTTLNDATMDVGYVTNVVLRGDITGYNEEEPELPFDLRGCPYPYPDTAVIVYTDDRISTAIEDSYVFFDHPSGIYYRDYSLYRLKADVENYSYVYYCKNILGGHVDSDNDTFCDECGCTIK